MREELSAGRMAAKHASQKAYKKLWHLAGAMATEAAELAAVNQLLKLWLSEKAVAWWRPGTAY